MSYLFLITLSFIISYIFFLHQTEIVAIANLHGDAQQYLSLGENITSLKIVPVRTYGYPLFLWFIKKFIALNNTVSLHILVIQYLIYLLSSLFFVSTVSNKNNIKLLIFSGLILNIYILSYFSVTLTECFSVCILLVSCGIFWGFKKNILRALLLGFLAAFSVEVRPANIWFFAFIAIIFFLECVESKNIKNSFLMLSLFALSSIGAFLPQLFINYHYFHKLTPLPTTNLGKLQYSLSVEIAHISFSSFVAIITPNPFLLTSHTAFQWLSLDGLSYIFTLYSIRISAPVRVFAKTYGVIFQLYCLFWFFRSGDASETYSL